MVKRSVRKLQFWRSAGSYAISLPRDWVQRTGLKKGDLIDVVEDDYTRLLVIPHNTVEAGIVLGRLLKELEKNFPPPPGQAPPPGAPPPGAPPPGAPTGSQG